VHKNTLTTTTPCMCSWCRWTMAHQWPQLFTIPIIPTQTKLHNTALRAASNSCTSWPYQLLKSIRV